MNLTPAKMRAHSTCSFNSWNIARISIIIRGALNEIFVALQRRGFASLLNLNFLTLIPIRKLVISLCRCYPLWIFWRSNWFTPAMCAPCSIEGRVDAIWSSIIFKYPPWGNGIAATKLSQFNSSLLQFLIKFIAIWSKGKGAMN